MFNKILSVQCPICESSRRVIKNGVERNGNIRFKCKSCNKSFTLGKETIPNVKKPKNTKLDRIINTLIKSGEYKDSGWHGAGYFSLFDMMIQSKKDKDFLADNLKPVAEKILSITE